MLAGVDGEYPVKEGRTPSGSVNNIVAAVSAAIMVSQKGITQESALIFAKALMKLFTPEQIKQFFTRGGGQLKIFYANGFLILLAGSIYLSVATETINLFQNCLQLWRDNNNELLMYSLKTATAIGITGYAGVASYGVGQLVGDCLMPGFGTIVGSLTAAATSYIMLKTSIKALGLDLTQKQIHEKAQRLQNDLFGKIGDDPDGFFDT